MSDDEDRDDDDFGRLIRLGIAIFIISILIGALFMLWQVLF
jgi:hypothetical protein